MYIYLSWKPDSMLTCSQHDAIQLNFTDIESFRTQLFRIQIQSIRAQLGSVRNQTAGRFVPISIYIYLQHLRREHVKRCQLLGTTNK